MRARGRCPLSLIACGSRRRFRRLCTRKAIGVIQVTGVRGHKAAGRDTSIGDPGIRGRRNIADDPRSAKPGILRTLVTTAREVRATEGVGVMCITKRHTVAVPGTCSKCQGRAVLSTRPVNSEFPDSPEPGDRESDGVEAVSVDPRGDVPGPGASAAARVAGRGGRSAACGAGRVRPSSRGAGDPRSGGRAIRGNAAGWARSADLWAMATTEGEVGR